jgi:hypothetical protein
MRTWLTVTFVLLALVLGTSFAHVLQWPAKLQYDGPLYTRLQTTLYMLWGPPSITGYVEPAALLAVVVLGALLRHEQPAFTLVAAAAGLLLLAFPVIFYWRVEPANVAFRAAALAGTAPKDWAAWRTRWETGHAVRFVLHLVAFVLLASTATRVGGVRGPNHPERAERASS